MLIACFKRVAINSFMACDMCTVFSSDTHMLLPWTPSRIESKDRKIHSCLGSPCNSCLRGQLAQSKDILLDLDGVLAGWGLLLLGPNYQQSSASFQLKGPCTCS